MSDITRDKTRGSAMEVAEISARDVLPRGRPPRSGEYDELIAKLQNLAAGKALVVTFDLSDGRSFKTRMQRLRETMCRAYREGRLDQRVSCRTMEDGMAAIVPQGEPAP
jgi:hypothetical protein